MSRKRWMKDVSFVAMIESEAEPLSDAFVSRMTHGLEPLYVSRDGRVGFYALETV